METKTIRFEKGECISKSESLYYFDDVPITHFYFDQTSQVYECLKSFTVQINIIEDEQE